MAKVTVDTNLLVYAIDTADRNKHRTVHTLLDTLVEQDTIVSLQALAEFFHVVTRKGRLSKEEARVRIGDWQALFPMIAAGPNTLSHAIDGLRRFQMPFWDATLGDRAGSRGDRAALRRFPGSCFDRRGPLREPLQPRRRIRAPYCALTQYWWSLTRARA
jgi:predicted nucleic acid-binding protein